MKAISLWSDKAVIIMLLTFPVGLIIAKVPFPVKILLPSYLHIIAVTDIFLDNESNLVNNN